MLYTDPLLESPAESDDDEVVVCELARHNIGFMYAGDTNEDNEPVFLVFGL